MKKFTTLIKEVKNMTATDFVAILDDKRVTEKEFDSSVKSDNVLNTSNARMNILVTEEMKKSFGKDFEFILNFKSDVTRAEKLHADFTNVRYKSKAIPVCTIYAHGRKNDYSDFYYDVSFTRNSAIRERYMEELSEALARDYNVIVDAKKGKESVAKHVPYDVLVQVIKLVVSTIAVDNK